MNEGSLGEMPKFADLTTPPAKRRGRPPKSAAVADRPAKKRKKRKYTRRAAKASTPLVIAREYSCFLDEEGGVQLARVDGEGEPLALNSADALAIAAFVTKHRGAIEA